MNPKVDAYVTRSTWLEEVKALRRIALDCGLAEDLKWGQPCYSHHKHNVVIVQEFKEYCALMFFKGALLQDAGGILVAPGESQAARQIRFTSVDQVEKMAPAIRNYIAEAIAVEEAGLKVVFKETTDFEIPPEFQSRLDEDPALKRAFEGLTPGRQRGYIHHFSAPKQSATRASRVEKSIPQILEGKGLND